jgi:hypothetical protein
VADRQRLARLRRSAIPGLAAVALMLLAAGCGGGDNKAATTSTTSSTSTAPAKQAPTSRAKAEYLRRGDAICNGFRTRRRTVLPQLNRAARAKDAAGLARVLRRIAVYSTQAFQRFRALPKPKGDEPTLNRYLALEQQLTSTLNRAAAAYEHGDVRGGTAIIDAQPGLPRQAREIATAYGFKVCGAA